MVRYNPFLPSAWQRGRFLVWLKRVHAWTGLWGALLFLLMGTSGFLLNHRAILKIDTGELTEVSTADVAVQAGSIGDGDALERWARQRFALRVAGKPPQPAKPGTKAMLGQTLPEAPSLVRVFTLPDAKLTVTHFPGSAAVSVKREALGLLGTIKNLHKGVGLGIAWVLLIDTIAGALVTMSVTGFLLWSRLHGSRLAAGVMAGGALAWALVATVPFFG